jgi:WD40 repeat protein
MKKSIFLFALLSVATFGFNRAMAIELDTVWVSDISGQVLFQHPVSKNILVAANGGITELNSQDGKLVRSFPFIISGNDLSPDGNLILMSGSDTKIFDFNTLEEKYVILKSTNARFLDNNTVIYRTVGENIIAKYDLKTKEKKEITPPNGGITAVATSPNGKYIAYATFEKITDTESKAHLYLVDAETMKGLGELGSWESEGQQIQDITFSPNSKYVTFNLSLSRKTQINIYELNTKTIFKSLSRNNFFYESAGFEFLGNDYYIKIGYSENQRYEFGIYKLSNHEEIFKTNKLDDFFHYSKFNSNKEHIIYNNYNFDVICIDFNKIISGIPQVVPISIEYSNKTLIINNYEKPINQISIITIEGREVFKQNIERLINMNNPIEIPLELSNGSYIINLVSDKETYTEKIIIVE